MVKIKPHSGMLGVTCPYTKAFVSFAKMRGGKWSDGLRQWLFDPRDEFAVRSTLVDIYGTDDYEHCAKTSVRLSLDEMNWDDAGRIFACGRELVRRKRHDAYVDLGVGVVVLAGGFPRESPRYKPDLQPEAGTVLEVRDVPVQAAEMTLQKWPDAVTVLGEYDISKLQEERRFHVKRIEELDALITRYDSIFREEDIIADLQDDDDATPAASSGETVEG